MSVLYLYNMYGIHYLGGTTHKSGHSLMAIT